MRYRVHEPGCERVYFIRLNKRCQVCFFLLIFQYGQGVPKSLPLYFDL